VNREATEVVMLCMEGRELTMALNGASFGDDADVGDALVPP
jgi:hypothetical protein